MSQSPSQPRNALVTGASSGIGAATAVALGRQGFCVALGARRLDRLTETARAVEKAGGRALVCKLDVCEPDSIEACFASAEAQLGTLDVVVNNAGLGTPALLHEAKIADLQTEIATNLTGSMLVARRAIPRLLEAGRGDLVFVSSQNAVLPRTFQTGYSASKAGIEAFARALQMELEGSGIRATIVRPGPVGTEFGSHYGAELTRRLLHSWKYWGVLRELNWLPASAVADAIVAVVSAPAGTHLDLVEVNPEGTRRSLV